MMAQNDWLFWIALSASQFVDFAIYLTGLVICLRRWHSGPGTGWAAAAFLLFLVNGISSLGINILFQLLSSSNHQYAIYAYSLISQLLAIGGAVCLVVGIRSMLTALTRRDDSILRPIDGF